MSHCWRGGLANGEIDFRAYLTDLGSNLAIEKFQLLALDGFEVRLLFIVSIFEFNDAFSLVFGLLSQFISDDITVIFLIFRLLKSAACTFAEISVRFIIKTMATTYFFYSADKIRLAFVS
jgi:hypothetical protein